MLVEGEEEVGSKNLLKFFDDSPRPAQVRRDRRLRHREHRGRPAEHHLFAARHRRGAGRGADREDAGPQRHGRRRLADAAIALNVILGRLYWDNGQLPIPGFYDQVRPLTDKERPAFNKLPFDEAKFRAAIGMVPSAKFAHGERAATSTSRPGGGRR